MSHDLKEARAKVRAALTAVSQTLTLPEQQAWREELAHLNAVIDSLTHRLNARAMREVRP